ncbi:PEP-CTERM sorting domain-containing protein [Tolypothrix sp. PCC 7910]|uniref:PEP-CTERM sorting domain-containing protein n=1 Tax=Tolypothrix sp. PCC 7910 TaxID=2099387 RepID=UPI0014278914|nr:PEP-CTERM sorting domain-containing protein [Tolypothrix sp. PCC 7910]QIR37619.1 PEP-CTERM sorting domain-containing protein [Tolypothrix sp. PCC 7910]
MKKRFVAAGFILFSFMLPLKANAAQFSGIYVFGDSLSDAGNVYNSTIDPKTGVGFPPPPYFDGNFSNGPIWIDELAKKLQLDSSPTLVTDVAKGTAPKNGINFAYGGATSIDKNTISPLLPGFKQQIEAFTTPLLQTKNADSNALYVLWTGANDYLPTNADPNYFKPFTDPTTTINRLRLAIASLADVGAKNILVVNLPDLGQLPRAQNLDPTFPVPSGTSQALTDLTKKHNSDLSDAIANLNKVLNPDVKLISLDANSVFTDIMNDTKNMQGVKYGFKEVAKPCLVDPSCAADPSIQNQYFFWDGLHPTTAAHKVLGDYAFQQIEQSIKPVPEPSTALGTVAIGAFGAAALLKRKRKQSLLRTASLVPAGQSTHTKVES